MTTASKYKPGDRVVGTVFLLRDKAGKIEKPAKASALVMWDGRSKPERVSLNSIEPETAEHVATRERAAAMEAWRLAQPKTTVARVEYGSRWGHSQDELGAELRRCRTPTEMRQAADELQLLARWFEQRPVERSKT